VAPPAAPVAPAAPSRPVLSAKSLYEVALDEPIRYNPGDPVERWLSTLLCLDSASPYRLSNALPPPKDCDLYFVDRDALFSYHKVVLQQLLPIMACVTDAAVFVQMSEAFLQRVMSLFVSSHYKVGECETLLCFWVTCIDQRRRFWVAELSERLAADVRCSSAHDICAPGARVADVNRTS
jgi:hypothetical protein